MSRSIWRFPQVLQETGLCRTTLNELEKAGKFPHRVLLSPRGVGWYSDQVQAWIDSRPAGKANAPTRATEASVEARAISKRRLQEQQQKGQHET